MRGRHAPDALLALREKYARKDYLVLGEVPYAGTGRRMDALVISYYASRGISLEGFEIKAARQDWLSELADPDKADLFVDFCSRWWIVATNPNVVKVEEIPKNWGLMVLLNGSLQVVKEAPELKAAEPDLRFLCGIIRQYGQEVVNPPQDALDKQYQRGFEDGRKHEEEVSRKRNDPESVQWLYEQLKATERKIEDFEEQTGIRISDWHAEEVVNAIRFLVRGGIIPIRRDLKNVQGSLEELFSEVAALLEKVKTKLAGLPDIPEGVKDLDHFRKLGMHFERYTTDPIQPGRPETNSEGS